MTMAEYKDLLIGICKMHIRTAQDELDNKMLFSDERIRKEGYINGLEQAIYTLEKSTFLTEGGE